MATPTKHSYAVAAAFAGGTVNVGTLEAGIRASSIVTALDRIDTSGGTSKDGVTTGGTIDVWFKDPLSAPDKATLDGNASAPAGGLLAAHDASPTYPGAPRTEKGVLLARPTPQTPGLEMCDRDFRLNTCVLGASSFQDLKVDVATRVEVNWGELLHNGVYKASGVAVADQADADANGVLSVWDYRGIDQRDGATLVAYEVRGGSLLVDKAIPASEGYDHRLYAVAAPDVPAVLGGAVRLFDGYHGLWAGDKLESVNPNARALDPALGPGASVLRIYLFHPAGAKRSHVLRLITYRPSKTG